MLSSVESLEELPPHFLALANLFTRFFGICFFFICHHYNYHGLELRFNVCEDKIKFSKVDLFGQRPDQVILVCSAKTMNYSTDDKSHDMFTASFSLLLLSGEQ